MKKSVFKTLLKIMRGNHQYALVSPTFRITYLTSKQVMELVGGGYGEYLGEPHTLGCYLVKEQLNGKVYWYLETTLPKKVFKSGEEFKLVTS